MPDASPRLQEQLLRPLEADAFPLDQLAPVIETCNVSGWGSGQLWLQKAAADVVVAQEHKQLQHQLVSAPSWAIRHGWKSLWAAAVTASGGGASAGVALFVREALGLSAPPSGHQIVAGRALVGVADIPGQTQLAI
eukprot:7731468-Pyramimonas_sp.AAC.1